jgi:hypothetical protein
MAAFASLGADDPVILGDGSDDDDVVPLAVRPESSQFRPRTFTAVALCFQQCQWAVRPTMVEGVLVGLARLAGSSDESWPSLRLAHFSCFQEESVFRRDHASAADH